MSVIVDGKGGLKLLAGLFWETALTDASREEVKAHLPVAEQQFEAVHEYPAVLSCLMRNAELTQIGLGDQPENAGEIGRKSKVRSLAALAVAHIGLDESGYGRLALNDEVHWIFVCRQGQVMPVGDLVVGADQGDEALSICARNNDDLEPLFDERTVEGGYNTILSWQEDIGSPRKLPNVVPVQYIGSGPVGKKQMVLLSVGAIVLIGGGLFANNMYESYLDRKEAAEQARQQAIREQEALAREAPKPWQEWPLSTEVAHACFRHFTERVDVRNGWRAVEWRCNGEEVTQMWRRSDIGSFSVLPVKDVDFDVSDPNRMFETVQIADLAPRGRVPLVRRDPAAKLLMDVARLHEMNIKVSWGNEEKRDLRVGDATITQDLGYAKHDASFRTNEQPSPDALLAMSAIPSLRLQSIANEGSEWRIEVDFYTAIAEG